MLKSMLEKYYNIFIGIGIAFYYIIIYFLSMKFELKNIKLIGTILIIITLVFSVISVIKEKKNYEIINYKKLIIGIMIVGIIIRTVYINYTTIYERQHDVDGHLDYIEYITENKKLPNSNTYQFYHPPLHHIISASWLSINESLDIEKEDAREGIQFLTAFYSSMVMFLAYCILKEIQIKDIYKLIVIFIMAVHPTFIILAGSINNDILLNMFIMFTLLYLIKWYNNSSYKNIIMLAIFTSLSMLSKISGALLAFPILFIFVAKFYESFKEQKNIKKYIGQFSIFAIISLFLGLSYAIRNYILFGQSIFFVPIPYGAESLFCGDKSIVNRFTIFSQDFLYLYCNPYEDCNIWSYIMKSSMFGEYRSDDASNGLFITALIMINMAVIYLSISNLLNIKRKAETRRNLDIINLMFTIYYIIQIIIYIYGNIKMPYGCTMDIRYIVPNIFIGMFFIAQSLERKSKNNVIDIYSIVIMFSALSIIFELTYLDKLNI